LNIVEILQQQSKKRPDAAAIIDVRRGKDRITTFAGLEVASAHGAALLKTSGLAAGDTVLVFLPMSAELYIALMTLFRLGITAMFLDPSAGREHIERCCKIRPPAALIAAPKAHLLRLISPALRSIPRHFSFDSFLPATIPWSRSSRLQPDLSILPCAPDTPALITFTSGSTGQPKATVRSHGFLLEQHRVLERAIHLTPDAIDLTTLPVFVLANLASGVTSLIPDADLRRPGNIEAQPVLRQVERYRPVSVAASPAFLECFCDACETLGNTVSGFRYVFTGGAPVFPNHLNRFTATFLNAEVVAVYGSTEAEPIAHIARKELTADDIASMSVGAGLLVGIPVAEISVRVILPQWGTPLGALDENGFSVICLPPGKTGEIVVNGGHVLKEYLYNVGDEETKFRVNGKIWHRTGDSGYFDDRGRLWLLGRTSAVINDDRGELYPFAVECAVRQLSAVSRAALVGRQNKRILFVQPRKGSRIDTDAVRDSLTWARLDEVRVLQEIPVDPRHNAKVDYGRLAKIV
jgi:acyl-CoA synthetase (AMP-forming)/AMP-acid ligase II